MFSDLLNDVILPALFSIAAAVVPILAGYIIDAVRKWGERQKAEWLRSVMSEAAEAAERAVMMVKQTYIDTLRATSVPSDTLDPKAARHALHMALDAARKQLGADGLKMLSKAVGGGPEAERVLVTLIEASVAKAKSPSLAKAKGTVKVSAAEFVAP